MLLGYLDGDRTTCSFLQGRKDAEVHKESSVRITHKCEIQIVLL